MSAMIMNIAFFFSIGFLVVTAVYFLAAIMYAQSDVNTFYKTLPINRFAFVIKGGKVVRIIYNSESMKLIEAAGFPLGKFVKKEKKDEEEDELQKLGPVEKLLGVRYIGIPFIHSLLEKKLSWIVVEGNLFKPNDGKIVSTFAITKTFGYVLKNLTLGSDSFEEGSAEAKKPKKNDREYERLLVNIKLMLQGTIVDPHEAIIATDWMASVEAKLTRFVQYFLGGTSQDELIAQKAAKNQLVQTIIDNKDELESFGVTFEERKITYSGYELAGDKDNITKVQAANTERFSKSQEAAGIREIKAAQQQDLLTQQAIMADTINKLTKEAGMSVEQAERLVLSMLRTKALGETKLGTLVEGGANVTPSLNVGSNKKNTP
jgi:hypothetical protein